MNLHRHAFINRPAAGKQSRLWPYLEVCSTAALLGILLFAPSLPPL